MRRNTTAQSPVGSPLPNIGLFKEKLEETGKLSPNLLHALYKKREIWRIKIWTISFTGLSHDYCGEKPEWRCPPWSAKELSLYFNQSLVLSECPRGPIDLTSSSPTTFPGVYQRPLELKHCYCLSRSVHGQGVCYHGIVKVYIGDAPDNSYTRETSCRSTYLVCYFYFKLK